MVQIISFAFVAIIVLFFYTQYRRNKKGSNSTYNLPADADNLLDTHVSFYKRLNKEQRKSFIARVQHFLRHTKVTGVGIAVTDLDYLLVAASAIIPLFNFPDWQYQNIDEVLLYPDTFSKDYDLESADRNVLGMVGNGAMNGQMILSLPALRAGFTSNDGHNTGIHEFVHLIDKADGSVDGVPEYLLQHGYIAPWLRQVHHQITTMRHQHTDIDEYGATNEAEFFAVVSEYFFEKPHELQVHHPELYLLLQRIFSGKPTVPAT